MRCGRPSKRKCFAEGCAMSLSLERLPLMRAAARSLARFDAAVGCVLAGIESGSIRNTDYQDVKYELSRAAEEDWRSHVSGPFFHAGEWERQSQDVVDLDASIMILSLHDVIATAKKVAKSKAEGPAVDAMRAYCAEVLPLAEAVASLKNKVVKGCPVCFRPIAVVAGRMAHHGYTRPEIGFQTASCEGVRFKPLEVSSEGLQWLIGALRKRLESRKLAYAERATQPEFLMARQGHTGAAIKVMRGDAQWPQVFTRHVVELRAEIAAIERELPTLDKMLADWKPEAVQ